MAQKTTRTRETKQRRVVYETIRKAEIHPTAEWIFKQARLDLPNISLATVYRNLTVLRDEGRVREVLGADRRSHYDAIMTPHAHFICMSCSDIWDVEGAVHDSVDWRELKDLVGCDVYAQHTEFHGLCAACRRHARN